MASQAPRMLIVGSGNAFNLDGRGAACIMLELSPGAPFLVDVGPTAVALMRRAGIEPGGLDRLFLTHLHGDHIAGWPFLLLDMCRRTRRRRPFHVHGPPGSRETLEGLSRLCYRDVFDDPGFELSFHEMEVASRTGHHVAPAVLLDTVPVDHDATSLGLRFRTPGVTVAISGDTGWCPGLEQLSRGCDVLVVECTTVSDEIEGHVSLDQIRRYRNRLEAGRCVLVHLTDAVAEALARDPIAGVLAGYDGAEVDLSAG